MANLKALKQRIRSVSNTQQITKAMKMVAAAKLRRAQENAVVARPYADNMADVTRSVAAQMRDGENMPPLMVGYAQEVKRVALVVCSADRGLCGGFNSSIIRAVRARTVALKNAGFDVSMIFLGRKAHDVLKRQFGKQVHKLYTSMGRDIHLDQIEKRVVADLLTDFSNHTFDACYLVYNAFQSAMSQKLTWRQLMPVQVDEKEVKQRGGQGSYILEPVEKEETVLDELFSRNVAVQIYKAVLESEASEHGARMTAMDNAVRNADDLIRKMTITYNRSRQAAITGELMEIIGGAEALKG